MLALPLVVVAYCHHLAPPPPPPPPKGILRDDEPGHVPGLIARFAADHPTGRWSVTVGHRQLPPAAAAALASLIVDPMSYADADVGCATKAISVRLARGGVVLPLELDWCNHVIGPGVWAAMKTNAFKRVTAIVGFAFDK